MQQDEAAAHDLNIVIEILTDLIDDEVQLVGSGRSAAFEARDIVRRVRNRILGATGLPTASS